MNNIVLDTEKKYLLALSGGVDSSVLFHMLATNNYQFRVVHFNHHTRGDENEKEAKNIIKMCEQFNILYDILDYKHEKGNFQSRARDFRLFNYKHLIDKYQLDGVILAHHGDDQIENIMMLEDKIGHVMMKELKIIDGLNIYRPMLNLYKSQIYDYAHKFNVQYFEDSSNTDVKYKRNFYRQKNQYSIVEKNAIIDLQYQRELFYEKTYNELTSTISKDYFEKFNDSYLLLYLFCKKHIDKNISISLLTMIINSIDFKGHKSFNLPGCYYLIQSYDKLFIQKEVVKEFTHEKELKLGMNDFNGIIFINSVTHGKIRTRRSNDRIKLKNGSKKITRIMIDMKIDRNDREIWPIVVDEMDNVLYIPKRIKK